MSIFRRITLPGFDRVPIAKVLAMLWQEVRSPIMILRAKAIAYSFFLAIFPTIIFLFSLLSFFPNNYELTENILIYLDRVSPNKQMVDIFKPLINEVVSGTKGSILSIGFILIIFFMKNGVVTMMQSFNVHFDIRSKKLFFKNQLFSILITFVVLLLFVLTIVLLVIGKLLVQKIFGYIDYNGGSLLMLFDIGRFGLGIFLNLLVISILYYLGPAIRPEQYKLISPGSLSATAMILIVSSLFSFYLKNFGSYNKVYGSLGVFVFMLIWLYWNALAILIGYELNRSIGLLKLKRKTVSAHC